MMNPSVFSSASMFGNDPPPLSDFGWRFLAEGDSWFTIGSLNLPKNSNLLFKLDLGRRTGIVTCAYPGDTLQHIVDRVNDPWFDRLLRHRRFASFWEAILISAGGNDLIDAAQHRALNADGSPAALDERVLLTPQEAAAVNPNLAGPERYVSATGWARLAAYLVANFRELVAHREQGPSAGRPIFLHTYHEPVVRPVGTVGSARGWLFAAMEDYGIPPADRQGLARVLFDNLRQLLLSLDAASGSAQALADVHVFDSASLAHLVPPDPASLGPAEDWVNEIHPSPAGYAKIGRLFGPWIDRVLAGYG